MDIFQDEVLLVNLTDDFLFVMDQFGNVKQVFCSFVRGVGEKAMKVWDKGVADFYLRADGGMGGAGAEYPQPVDSLGLAFGIQKTHGHLVIFLLVIATSSNRIE